VSDNFTEMLGVLAHEMRTPISAILGYQELLAEGIFGDIDPRGQEPLARIAYSAKQLLHLIDGVQEVASPPEKRLEVHPKPFDPAPVLHDCVHHAVTDAVGRSINLEPEISEQLPRIYGDPDRFCRAIDLALAAAIKTSHGGTLGLTARADGNMVQVSISGTGLQLGRDDPPLLGAPGNGANKLTGAGLRLAIVRHLTRQMNGDVKLQPTDAGTTLLLQIPVSS
jgi:signal transduction histidine kinase